MRKRENECGPPVGRWILGGLALFMVYMVIDSWHEIVRYARIKSM